MAKYVAYVNIENMGSVHATAHVADVSNSIKKDLMEPGDKLLVLAIKTGPTRIEVLPNV